MLSMLTCINSYREDLFVGYKHYQARNIKPLFPFGYVMPHRGIRALTYHFADSVSHIPSFPYLT